MSGGRQIRNRRPAWRTGTPSPRDREDGGPLALESLGKSLSARASGIFHSNVTISVGHVSRCRIVEADDGARIFSARISGRLIWCIVNDKSWRALLECILEGPGAARLTAVERAIVDECLHRLLATRASEPWCERAAAPFDGDTWRCTITIAGERACSLLDLCTHALPLPTSGRPQLDEIPLTLCALLRPLQTTLGALAEWRLGSRLPLGGPCHQLPATLSVADGPVLFGMLGESAGRRAIRLSGDAARGART